MSVSTKVPSRAQRPYRVEATPDEAVKRFLLTGLAPEEAHQSLAEAGLASHVLRQTGTGAGRAALPSTETPGLRALRSARLTANARHVAVRAAVLPLIAAWRAVDIETLLFKGFYLAETVYQEPADRPYSDVDVSLRPGSRVAGEAAWREAAARAAEVAAYLGWSVVWRLGEDGGPGAYHRDEYDGHELLQLTHRSGIHLDAHRRMVHNNVNVWRGSYKADRLTEEVWLAADTQAIGGVEVYVPAAVDSILVGLVLARSWSGDVHALRPHDYLDLDALVRHGGLDETRLWERAGELGLTRTLRSFLRRCDPKRHVLSLGPPSQSRRLVIDLEMMPERFPRGVANWLQRASTLPNRSLVLVRALRLVGARLAGRDPGPNEARPTPDGAGRDLDKRSWVDLQVATRRALLLNGVAPEVHARFALSSLERLATACGYSVTFVEAHTGGWLEWRGEVLPLRHIGSLPGDVWPLASTARLAPAWKRFRRLSLRDLSLRLAAYRELREVRAELARRPFAQVQADLAAAPAGTHVAIAPRDVGRAVESAARYVPGALCLAQALTAQAMLRRRGAPSTLHLGFLRDAGGEVTGHAWLEAGGTAVTGDIDLDRFTRTARFDA